MGVPSRRIGKSYRSSTGVIQSSKDQSRQKYESRLERDLITLIDSDPTVLLYQAQPVTLPYEMKSGKQSHCVPPVGVRNFRGELSRCARWRPTGQPLPQS